MARDETCASWQESISAMVDGEDPEIDPQLVEAHLRRCAECQAFQLAAERTRRLVRVQPAPTMPDLSGRVTKLAAIADRASAWGLVRAALAVVAIEILVLSVPSLLATGQAGFAHDARHLGAFTAAYGVGLLVVVARPARARTMLPVAGVLAAALLITAVVDMFDGRIPLIGEVLHVPELLSVVLIWLLAVPRRRPRARSGVDPTTIRPTLTVVAERDRDAG